MCIDGAKAGTVHESLAKVDIVYGVVAVLAVAVIGWDGGEKFLVHTVFEILLLFALLFAH